jgi:hypothetical protein
MHHRYIVVADDGQWMIVRSCRRHPKPYPSKTQAVCAAIALAENDADAGAEVLVRHEDGYFLIEWVHGQDQTPGKAARSAQPDECGPQGGYGGTGPDQDHPGN